MYLLVLARKPLMATSLEWDSSKIIQFTKGAWHLKHPVCADIDAVLARDGRIILSFSEAKDVESCSADLVACGVS